MLKSRPSKFLFVTGGDAIAESFAKDVFEECFGRAVALGEHTKDACDRGPWTYPEDQHDSTLATARMPAAPKIKRFTTSSAKQPYAS
jgi:hypothetical protein